MPVGLYSLYLMMFFFERFPTGFKGRLAIHKDLNT